MSDYILSIDFIGHYGYTQPAKLVEPQVLQEAREVSPDSTVVVHLHGKQKVVGSIPILGRKAEKNLFF